MTELACVTGRFQPVHHQHLELFELALHRCEHLVVAITNPDLGARHEESTSAHRHTDAANPFTYFERVQLLDAALTEHGWGERTTIVPFDLTRPGHWAEYVPLRARHFVRAYSDWERQKAQWVGEAGYPVTVLDGDPARKLSATDIRRLLAGGTESWKAHVPASVVPVLDRLLAETPMEARQ
jgi:nicotinamide-nucleotide adenylyltransferase